MKPMTFETLQQGMSMFDCHLSRDNNEINLEFEQIEVSIDKDFDLGMAEARVFMLYNWLKHLRETLDEEIYGNPFEPQ